MIWVMRKIQMDDFWMVFDGPYTDHLKAWQALRIHKARSRGGEAFDVILIPKI
jgi:hypothetical protein